MDNFAGECMSNDLLTCRQVAVRLNLHPTTVYRLIRERELPAIKIGRSYRIPLAALERRLEVPQKPSKTTRGPVC